MFPTSSISRLLTSALIAGAVSITATSQAFAISNNVKMACIGDYFSYCSQHAVGSQALRACMSDNGLRLSKRCVTALIQAGEVSKDEVARRAASAR